MGGTKKLSKFIVDLRIGSGLHANRAGNVH